MVLESIFNSFIIQKYFALIHIFGAKYFPMKFIYVVVLLTFFGCGPTEKEKKEIENEIISIKAHMINLMNESSDLVIDIDEYKTHTSNIEKGENLLNEISQELKEATPGSDEEKNLKIREERILSRLAIEKEKLQRKGNLNLMEKELQSYGVKYDSLESLLKEKTNLIN
jgi:hypothetical protein